MKKADIAFMQALVKKQREKHKDLIRTMQMQNKCICEYCGAEKAGLSFFIGATSTPDWVMVEGTGKMACPACAEKAAEEGRKAVARYIGM